MFQEGLLKGSVGFRSQDGEGGGGDWVQDLGFQDFCRDLALKGLGSWG